MNFKLKYIQAFRFSERTNSGLGSCPKDETRSYWNRYHARQYMYAGPSPKTKCFVVFAAGPGGNLWNIHQQGSKVGCDEDELVAGFRSHRGSENVSGAKCCGGEDGCNWSLETAVATGKGDDDGLTAAAWSVPAVRALIDRAEELFHWAVDAVLENLSATLVGVIFAISCCCSCFKGEASWFTFG